ncbi:hypothetical protein [Aliikangiella maris]|uniref:Uncharacterized protein n=2 Tax=Aliikangiella maris TaxID=3162458 RepID=A0ABV3MN66_9GAMM
MTANLAEKLQYFWQLKRCEKVWIFILFPLSGLIRLISLIIPLGYLTIMLGRKQCQIPELVVNFIQLGFARRIGQIIDIMAKYTPWKTDSVVRVLLARILLSYYQIPHVTYLGLKTDESNPNCSISGSLSTQGLYLKRKITCAWIEVRQTHITGLHLIDKLDAIDSYVGETALSSVIDD